MNKTRLWIALAALAVATLACNAITGGLKTPATPATGGDSITTATETVPSSQPTAADSSSGSTNTSKSGYPLPDGVSNLTDLGDNTVNFQVSMSLKDIMQFYRDAFSKQGYKERSALTVTSDATFNMVFDGHKSGKAIVIQGVDLGGGVSNVSIRLEAVP